MTSSKPSHLPPPKVMALGSRLQHMNFWRTQTFSPQHPFSDVSTLAVVFSLVTSTWGTHEVRRGCIRMWKGDGELLPF